MKIKKICVVVTARPSYSRVRSLLFAIKKHPKLELKLVIAGSALLDRYGSILKTVEDDGFIIDKKIYIVLEGEGNTSMAKTTGLGLMELATAFSDIKPDLVIAIADRYETIAVSIAAAYQNIPLAHLQGGEVTGNIDEKVRHANTKLADIHFVATDDARERVIKLGENPEMVFKTGCPSIDNAAAILSNPTIDFSPYSKYGGVGTKPDLNKGFLIVLQHPVTTEKTNARKQIEVTLSAINSTGMPTLWFWPNVDSGSDNTSKGIRAFRESYPDTKIHFLKSVDPKDFLLLLFNCKCIIGNSSVAIRECSFLGVPAVNIGTRQNMRARGGNTIDTNYSQTEIINAINYWIKNKKPQRSYLYGKGDAGEKIANLISNTKVNYHKTISY